MEMESAQTILDKLGQEDMYDTFLRYGLFVAAIIQLICIGSAIFLPYPESEESESDKREDQKKPSDIINAARRHHKIRKLEKKKRR